MSPPGTVVRTVGHGTLQPAELAALVHGADVEVLVDVRRYPGSRRHPHVGSDAMAAWLPEHGLGYRWLPGLGGRRRPDAASPNIGLRNEQFRAYADHMATAEFAADLAVLKDVAATSQVAVMCAESVWWRCHRRLLADHLVLLDGVAVEHLFHDGRLQPHPKTPEARVLDHHLRYDVGAQPPLAGT